MPLLALVLLLPLLVVALLPIALVQRIRRGSARRPARGWVASANLFAVLVSAVMLLIGALVTSRWVPDALPYTVAGLAAGFVLGTLGFVLTRWDVEGGRLHYTPHRWLVLAVTLIVAVRIGYGFWRTWEAWQASAERMALVAAGGAAGSMAAGAVVLGYYVIYWTAIRRRLRRARVELPRRRR
jgi:hypothetical protein